LQDTRSKLQQVKEQLKQSREQLKKAQDETEHLQGKMTAMETSKFWKLRQSWFGVKRTLRLPVDDI
jgi:chromosome segregation ATPase